MVSSFVTKGLVAATAVALIAGCGGAGNSSRLARPSFDGSSGQGGLTITIENQQLNEARISLWIDGSRRRLGTVQAHATETFRLPIDAASTVRMEFDLTLSVRCETRSVMLGPGEVIHVIIPSNLRMMDAICRGESRPWLR